MPVPNNKKKSKPEVQPEARKIAYPDIKVVICRGEAAITAEQAKELLGWEEVTDNTYMFKDEEGKGIRCLNNTKNRPYNDSHGRRLAQDILNRRYILNGETIIIGETGLVLSGQHRLIGLVLANQIWAGNQNPHWIDKGWTTPPVMESLVCFGVPEDNITTNTLDNVRPRSLSDVLYVSEYFQAMPNDKRVKACKSLEHCVRMEWDRLGVKDAFSPYMTHSTCIEFLDRHPGDKEAIEVIYKLDKGEGLVSKYISLGYAAALYYLMAASETDFDHYNMGTPPDESRIKWKTRKAAKDFWEALSKGQLKPLTDARRPGAEGPYEGYIFAKPGGSMAERVAFLIRGWLSFLKNGNTKVMAADLKLTYLADEDGIMVLKESPTIGGIDCGVREVEDPEEEGQEDGGEEGQEDGGEEGEPVPTPEEIKEEKERIKAANLEALKARHKKKGEDDRDESRATGSGKALVEQLEELRKEYPGHIFLFKGQKELMAWGSDASSIGAVLKIKPKMHADGLLRLSLPNDKEEVYTTRLTEEGYRVAICEKGTDGRTVAFPVGVNGTVNGEVQEEEVPQEEEAPAKPKAAKKAKAKS